MNAVLTGDNTNITPYIVLMIVAIVVVAGDYYLGVFNKFNANVSLCLAIFFRSETN